MGCRSKHVRTEYAQIEILRSMSEAEKWEQLLVSKMRERSGSARAGFRSMDRRHDGVVAADELQAGAAKVFGLDMPQETAAAIVARHSGSAGAMSFHEFCELWDGTFTRWVTSSEEGEANPTARHVSPLDVAMVAPSKDQAQAALLSRVGQKLRALTTATTRSRHFTEMFLRFDLDRTNRLSYDEVALGLGSCGIELSAADVWALCATADPERTGHVSLYGFLTLMQRAVRGENPIDEVAAAAAEDGAAAAEEDAALAAQLDAQLELVARAPPPPPRRLHAAPSLSVGDGAPAAAAVSTIVRALQKTKLDLRTAFSACDADGDGALTPAELASGLGSIGVEISPERAARLVAAHDRDGSGTLRHYEFVSMISTTTAQVRTSPDLP